ncbi:hypothetical protein JD844_010228 [Phrynosoma platyrhinos]|uniref:A-kinase anchor protein 2 C-terminal domain-containing protein n=1 Tax=Phrynosoma platyrhinos TaxID=52577 RepID=A0ABQ7TH10_PHRPL|nr:hypothetical protein JD844_010228 [Phrynosoma platyrhinos]
MTTETLSLAPATTGVCHRSQETSEVDIFRDMVESRDVTENVPITTTPGDSLVPPLDCAKSSLAKDQALEESPSSAQKDDGVEKAAPSLTMPSEEIKMADDVNQSSQGQDGGHSVHQEKMPEFSSEQLKAEDTLGLLAKEEDGRHFECHSEIPHAFSELQSPARSSVLEGKEEEEKGRQHHCHSEDPSVPADSLEQLEVSEEAEGSPLVHHHSTSDVPSEQQESASPSVHPDINKESGIIMDSRGQPPEMCLGSPQKLELVSLPTQAVDSQENSHADCAAGSSPESPSRLLMETPSPKEPGEGDSSVFPSNLSPSPASPAESQGSCPAEGLHEDIKPDCQEIAANGKEERAPSRQVPQPPDYEKSESNLNGQSSQAGSGNNLLANEEQVAQDTAEMAPSVASADPLPDAEPHCQQMAAGTGSSGTASQAVPTKSPVATGIFGPAHEGLAAASDREGRAICEPSGAGKNSKPQTDAEAEAVLESEKGEEATRDAEPEETTRELEQVKDLSEAENLVRDFPVLRSPPADTDPVGPKDPERAMVLASAEEPLEARDRADSQDLARTTFPVAIPEQAGPDPSPPERLLLDARGPAKSAFTQPISDEPSTMAGLCCPTNWTGGAPDHPETPIEREIRLHLEREELLRQERGLASLRGKQEYVEVRIRPFLNQSGMSSTLPKEKERQWAGAQMQREIQRECRREEDLVQLGKVRGAYDRGTPQELQEKKMIFEQHTSLESLAPRKVVGGSAEGARGPSYAEANRAPNMVILDSEALLQPQRPPLETSSPSGNPFFCLRAKSAQSLLEQEVQEAQERERELQRQRYCLYGSISPCQPAETSEPEEKEVPNQPGQWPRSWWDVGDWNGASCSLLVSMPWDPKFSIT